MKYLTSEAVTNGNQLQKYVIKILSMEMLYFIW